MNASQVLSKEVGEQMMKCSVCLIILALGLSSLVTDNATGETVSRKAGFSIVREG
jgi:hypothetical protein